MSIVRLTVYLCFSMSLCAQTAPSPTGQTQTSAFVPFVKQVKKTVVFIELTCKKDGKTLVAQGTGFVVAFPSPYSSDEGFDYLVTNRHVALCWDENRKPMGIQSVRLRGNLKDGSSPALPFIPKWVFPLDDSVDLAVSPLGMSGDIDIKVVPTSIFATKDLISKRGIVEGTRILFTGFFYQFPGERHIQPIIREGVLAMMPDEPITTTTGRLGNVFLGDVHIFHGNSGSPVFVELETGLFPSLQTEYLFLGVVSGNFNEDQDFNLEIDTTLRGTQHANSGIAIIVPADEVKSIIENDPQLRRSGKRN